MVMRDQLGELYVPITADTSGLDRSLQQSKSKLQRASASMRDVGKKMTAGVTLPIVAAGGAFVKMASDHESSFAGVRKTVDATEAEYAELSSTFRDMAKEIPISVNEINRIGEAAGQLGIEKQNIADFSRVMADLGVATNMASEDAATSLARLANITGMPQENFDRLGSTVVDLGNNLATTESEIVDMSLRLAGAGNQVGLTEHQILSMSAAMSSVGIRAEAGGTAMSRVMQEMQTHVGNAGRELEVLADVAGMSTSEFAKLFEQDATKAITAFTGGLDRMNESGQNVSPVLGELGFDSVRIRDTLLRAAGAGDLFNEALEVGSKAWEENSALTKEAETRYGTFESQVKILRNRLQDMAITIGQPLMHALNNAIEQAEPLISWAESMAEKFANLSPKMQGIILGVAGLAAAAGPALIALGLMLPALAAIGGAIGLVLSPIALLVGAVVGLGIVVFKNFDAIRDAVGSAVGWLGERLGVDFVGAFRDAQDAITDTFGEAASLLRAGEFSAAANNLVETAQRLIGTDLIDAFVSARDAIRDTFDDVSEAMRAGDFTGALGIIGERMANAVLAAAVRTVEALASFRDSVTGWLDANDIGGMISGAFTGGDGASLGERISGSIESARVRVASGLTSLNTAVTEWRDANDPAQQIADAWGGGGGPSIGDRIGNFITEDIPKIWESLGEMLSGIGDWFKNEENLARVIGFAAGFVAKWFSRWALILTEGVPRVTGAIAHFLPSVIEKLDEIYPAVVDAGTRFVEDLVTDLREAWDSSLQSLAEIWRTLSPKISSALNDIQPEINESGRSAVTEFIDSVTEWFDVSIPEIGAMIRSKMPDSAEAVKEGIRNAAQAGREAAPLIIKGIINAYIAAAPTVLTTLREIALTWASFMKEVPGILAVVIMEMGRTIMSLVGTAITSAWFLVRRAMEEVRGRLSGSWLRMWQAVEDVIAGARNNIRGFVDDITGPLQRVIDIARKALDWLNKVRNAPKNFIGGVGSGIGGFVGQFSPFAEGGIVTSPTLALIGEKGPEAVVPLNRDDRGGGLGGGDVHVTQNFYGDTNPADQARRQERAMRRLALEGGLPG